MQKSDDVMHLDSTLRVLLQMAFFGTCQSVESKFVMSRSARPPDPLLRLAVIHICASFTAFTLCGSLGYFFNYN